MTFVLSPAVKGRTRRENDYGPVAGPIDLAGLALPDFERLVGRHGWPALEAALTADQLRDLTGRGWVQPAPSGPTASPRRVSPLPADLSNFDPTAWRQMLRRDPDLLDRLDHAQIAQLRDKGWLVSVGGGQGRTLRVFRGPHPPPTVERF